MRTLFIRFLFLSALVAPGQCHQLLPETKKAWQSFVETTDARVEQEARHPDTFLVVDRSPKLRARVQAGEIPVYPATRQGVLPVPSGLIHDWIGDVFIPNVTAKQVIETARDYDEYPNFFKPSVLKARQIKEGDEEACAFSLLMRQKVMFVDSALDGQYKCSYFNVSPSRWYSFTSSTRLQEILNYSRANEQVFSPDSGDGFIWRLHSVLKYEEADGGVYLELEAAALSRSIPASIRWMVSGVVEKISRSALMTTLRQTREANIQAKSSHPSGPAVSSTISRNTSERRPQ